MIDFPLFCEDFPTAESCCPSCHEDEEMGYDPLDTFEKDGTTQVARVCCAKYGAVKAEGWR